VVDWGILTLVLLGDVLLLLLVKDNYTTRAVREGHMKYFALYLNYRSREGFAIAKITLPLI
jgi:hypothetical protein